MKILYQGTGAAEGIPALFCRCKTCLAARKAGGREIRTRSGALVDGAIKLDFGPDSFAQMLSSGIDYASLHTVLVTHTHADHFDVNQMELRRNAFARFEGESPIMSVYGNYQTGQLLRQGKLNENIRFCETKAYETIKITGYGITALDAVHCVNGNGKYPVFCGKKQLSRSERAFMYLIEKDGKSLLYAHDTDVFCDEAMEFLSGKRINLISLDCSNGVNNAPFAGHMGIGQVKEMRRKLTAIGAAEQNTVFVASHFCHMGYTDMPDMTKRLEGIIPAYDGLEISI